MQLGTRLELDPADPLAVQEHRRQSEPPAVFGHHLGGRSDVGVEPRPQIGELGLERGRGDQSGVSLGDQPPGVVPGVVVGTGCPCAPRRGPRRRGSTTCAGSAGRAPRPGRPGPRRTPRRRWPAGPASRRRGRGAGRGPVARPEVAEQPRGDGHPQEQCHAERDEEPPGVPAEPAIEGARYQEPGEGRRVAQVFEPFEPRGVLGRLGDQVSARAALPVRRRPPRLGVGGRPGGLSPRRPVRTGGGASAGVDPNQAHAGTGLDMEVDRPEVLDAGGGQCGHRVGGAAGAAPARTARSSGSWLPRWRSTRRSSTPRKRIRATASAGWASMARPAVAIGVVGSRSGRTGCRR